MAKIGRPSLYGPIVMHLEWEVIYIPATIAEFAHRMGLLPEDVAPTVGKLRLRHALGRMTHNKRHLFPVQGDGHVRIYGQTPMPGWYGWRWQRAYHHSQRQE